MPNQSDRPLIVEAEGRDQDERAALGAAIAALLNRSDRRKVTDCHVFELIKWVHRLDKGKVGAQLSHYQIAKQLWLEVPTARSVIRRATDELGLLLKSEQRYVTNGQQANRYEINWTLVRSINRGQLPRDHVGAGDTRYQGADTVCQPPDTTYQGADTMDHPYKDITGLLTESLPEPPPTPDRRACAENQEEEVAGDLAGEGTSLDAGCPSPLVLVRVAKPRAVLAADDLVDAYRRANVYDATELLGWLLPRVGREYLQRLLEYWHAHKSEFDGAGALRIRLKRSHQDLAIDEGWPPPRAVPKPPPKVKSPEQYAAERAAFAEAKRIAKAAAEAEVDLADQFKRLKEQQKEQS